MRDEGRESGAERSFTKAKRGSSVKSSAPSSFSIFAIVSLFPHPCAPAQRPALRLHIAELHKEEVVLHQREAELLARHVDDLQELRIVEKMPVAAKDGDVALPPPFGKERSSGPETARSRSPASRTVHRGARSPSRRNPPPDMTFRCHRSVRVSGRTRRTAAGQPARHRCISSGPPAAAPADSPRDLRSNPAFFAFPIPTVATGI